METMPMENQNTLDWIALRNKLDLCLCNLSSPGILMSHTIAHYDNDIWQHAALIGSYPVSFGNDNNDARWILRSPNYYDDDDVCCLLFDRSDSGTDNISNWKLKNITLMCLNEKWHIYASVYAVQCDVYLTWDEGFCLDSSHRSTLIVHVWASHWAREKQMIWKTR